jgi:hypothetical protein
MIREESHRKRHGSLSDALLGNVSSPHRPHAELPQTAHVRRHFKRCQGSVLSTLLHGDRGVLSPHATDGLAAIGVKRRGESWGRSGM